MNISTANDRLNAFIVFSLKEFRSSSYDLNHKGKFYFSNLIFPSVMIKYETHMLHGNTKGHENYLVIPL